MNNLESQELAADGHLLTRLITLYLPLILNEALINRNRSFVHKVVFPSHSGSLPDECFWTHKATLWYIPVNMATIHFACVFIFIHIKYGTKMKQKFSSTINSAEHNE